MNFSSIFLSTASIVPFLMLVAWIPCKARKKINMRAGENPPAGVEKGLIAITDEANEKLDAKNKSIVDVGNK